MFDFELRSLRLEDEALFAAAMRAFDEPGFIFALHYDGHLDFPAYVRRLEDKRLGRDLRPPQVPETMLFAFAEGAPVGRISIRHSFNELLARTGGHIGYGVVPGFRRRGFATEMLRRALPIAKSVGVHRALLTCDESNRGSRKTIETCGGVFESQIHDPATGITKRRFWIEIEPD